VFGETRFYEFCDFLVNLAFTPLFLDDFSDGFFGVPWEDDPVAGLFFIEVLGKRLLESVFLPKAHLAEGLALADCEAVSASMDSSDGLAWSLHELGRLSNVGFLLESVPIAPEATEFAELNGLDACELTLYGGEEYELVLTIKPESLEVAKAAVKAAGGQLICIGKATKDKQILLEANGKKSTIEPRGWEHFKSRV